MTARSFLWILVFIAFQVCNSYKILVVAPVAARSHYTLMSSLAKGLAEAGHDVTIISPYTTTDVPKNGSYKEVNTFVKAMEETHIKFFDLENMNPIVSGVVNCAIGNLLTEATLTHPNVQKLLNSKEQFDVVIIEQFVNDALKVIAHHYEAPLILFSTIGANDWVNTLVGNPSPASYVSSIFLDFGDNMTFWERSYNSIVRLVSNIYTHYVFYHTQEKIMKTSFPKAPDLNTLLYNVSLVLINSHESVDQAVPHVPNMVQIGGFHVKPPKQLPKDLQTFLDEATDGVIYFSLGSNVKPSEMSNHIREAIIKSFKKIKQKILWKWDEDLMPDQPINVKVSKWFPQQDILAHPNVKLFITHAGLLSILEAVYHGVPMLALPVFGDQKLNALRAERNGFALRIPFSQITEEKLTEALQKLLSDAGYQNTAKKRSVLFHDRPMKPMDLAIYWTEFVIRHGGTSNLKVAGVDLPWFQYYLLDVIGFLIIAVGFVCLLFVLVFKNFCKGNKQDLTDKKIK